MSGELQSHHSGIESAGVMGAVEIAAWLQSHHSGIESQEGRFVGWLTYQLQSHHSGIERCFMLTHPLAVA